MLNNEKNHCKAKKGEKQMKKEKRDYSEIMAENGQKGGEASGVARRKKGLKAIKKAINEILKDRENLTHKNIAKYSKKHINTITKYKNFIIEYTKERKNFLLNNEKNHCETK